MAEVRVVNFGPKPRLDLAEHLERLAERVRAGGVEDIVLFYDGKDSGLYHYEATCTLERAVALTALAHNEALGRMRGG
jgi:hypothetical protein